MEAKRDLRRRMREATGALPPARRALEEELVASAIQDSTEWRAARTVLLYRSVAPEFSTVGLVLGAWRAGKCTVFPRVEADGLTLWEVRSWSGFGPGAHGIPEPIPAAQVATGVPGGAAHGQVDASQVDLAILPGTAWTADGHRLGRGGGHFDRLLPSMRCPVWGIGFDVQVVRDLPREGHDQKVARVWHAAALG